MCDLLTPAPNGRLSVLQLLGRDSLSVFRLKKRMKDSKPHTVAARCGQKNALEAFPNLSPVGITLPKIEQFSPFLP